MSKTPSLSSLSWKKAFYNHFLLFGFYLTPKEELRRILTAPSKKQILIAVYNALGCAILISLSLQGMMDGPEVLSNYMAGNFTTWSKTLFGWSIFTFLFLFAIILGVGFILPLLFYTLLNKRQDDDESLSVSAIIIISSYAMFPIMFLTPIIYCFSLFTVWETPQLIHLFDTSYENNMIYAFGALVAIAILISIKFISIVKMKSTRSKILDK